MRSIVLFCLISSFFSPINIQAQNEDAAAAIAGGLLAIGGAIATIEQYKEELEQKAVEQVLNEYSELVNFELKTNSLNGTKLKNLANVSVLTFEIRNLDNNERLVLFAFLSSGWANSHGNNFNKIKWKLFSQSEWNSLILAYVETASKQTFSVDQIQKSKIVNKGVKQGGKYIIEFDKIKGDVYYTSNYSDEFKLVFNEKSLGLYLKNTEHEDSKEEFRVGGVRGDLVQIRRKTIIKAHTYINNQY